MPIKGTTDVRRLPRLGKIRLGLKVEGATKSPYPQPTDYFVCPAEVAAVYGQKPMKLDILFPVEDDEIFAQQWYRVWQSTVTRIQATRKKRLADIDSVYQEAVAKIETRASEAIAAANKKHQDAVLDSILLPEKPGK